MFLRTRILASCFAMTILLTGAVAWADIDLVPLAGLRVSGVEANDESPLPERHHGAAALRDGNPDTQWNPPDESNAWITLDLAGDSRVPSIELDRVELDWCKRWSSEVRLYGGPDAGTLRLLARNTNPPADGLTLVPFRSAADVRHVRLEFEKGDFTVCALRLFAKPSPNLPAVPPTPTVEENTNLLRLSVSVDETAHHAEMEIRRGEATEILPFFGSTFLWKSPLEEDLAFRVRAVGSDGQSSAWSSPVTATANGEAAPAPLFGVWENHDGPLFSVSEHIHVLRAAATLGFGHYIYAPGDDEKRSTRWSETYETDEQALFESWLSFAPLAEMKVLYQLTPGADFDPVSDEDFATLTAKIAHVLDLGFSRILLSLENLEPADEPLTTVIGERHRAFVDKLQGWLGERQAESVIIIPAVSTGIPGSLSENQTAYLQVLSQADAAILFAWGGGESINTGIRTGQVTTIQTFLQRPVLVLDSYPAQSDEDSPRLFMVAPANRDDTILNEAAGYAVGLAPHAAINVFSLAQSAEHFLKPDWQGDDAAAIACSLSDVDLNTEQRGALVDLFAYHPQLTPDFENAEPLRDLLGDVLSAYDLQSEIVIEERMLALIEHLAFYNELALRLETGRASPDFSDALAFPLETLSAQIRRALRALNLLTANLYGQRMLYKTEETAYQAETDLVNARPYPVLADALADLWDAVPERESARFEDRDFLYPFQVPALSNARLGQPWTYDAGYLRDKEACSYRILGLDGEVIDADGMISYTPPDSETRRGILIGSCDHGLINLPFTLNPSLDLHPNEPPSLASTSTLTEIDGLTALVQSGLLYPEPLTHSWNKSSLNGSWKKRRAMLDQDLTLARRDDEVLDALERESGGAILPEFDDTEWETVTLPSVENLVPSAHHEDGPERYFGGVWYRRETELPQNTKALRLAILGASYVVDVWLDGLHLGCHEGGQTAAYFQLPTELVGRKKATLALRVDAPDPARYKGLLWRRDGNNPWPFVGILRDIQWEYLPTGKTASLGSVRIHSTETQNRIQADIFLQSFGEETIEGAIEIFVYQLDYLGSTYATYPDVAGLLDQQVNVGNETRASFTLTPGGFSAVRLSSDILNALPWQVNLPRLYGIKVVAFDNNGPILDSVTVQFGLRRLALHEDGAVQFNDVALFLPGLVVQEDRSTVQSDPWLDRRQELLAIKGIGARLLHFTGGAPDPSTAYLTDRLGLVAMLSLPDLSGDLESLQAAKDRGILEQTWRETIFSNFNRSSILFWSPGPYQNAEEKAILDTLTDDYTERYPDGRWSLPSVDAETAAQSPALLDDKAPLAHVTLTRTWTKERTEQVEHFLSTLQTLHDTKPDKPLLLGGAGLRSADVGRTEQAYAFESLWYRLEPHATFDTDGLAREENAWLAGALWDGYADVYTAGLGLDTCGILEADRSSRKPVYQFVDEAFQYYRDDWQEEKPIPDNKNDEGCSCRNTASSLSWFGFLALLILAALRRRTRKTLEAQRL